MPILNDNSSAVLAVARAVGVSVGMSENTASAAIYSVLLLQLILTRTLFLGAPILQPPPQRTSKQAHKDQDEAQNVEDSQRVPSHMHESAKFVALYLRLSKACSLVSVDIECKKKAHVRERIKMFP